MSNNQSNNEVKIWPDDYSEDELVEEAAWEIVEGVLEGASFEYCVEHAHEGFGDTDLTDRKEEIKEKAKTELNERGIEY